MKEENFLNRVLLSKERRKHNPSKKWEQKSFPLFTIGQITTDLIKETNILTSVGNKKEVTSSADR